MAVSFKDIGEDLRHIYLSGRLDIQGTEEIAPRFSEFTIGASKRHVVVDFSSVTFLASIGIRALISNAKALHKQGGRMAVVVGDNTSVFRTLEAVGIDALLHMEKDIQAAEMALLGQAQEAI